jgi:hypothetical protein
MAFRSCPLSSGTSRLLGRREPPCWRVVSRTRSSHAHERSDGSRAGSRGVADRNGPLPALSLPPRLVDTAVVVVLGLLYAGYVTANVVRHGWTPHLVAVAAGALTVLAFFWRRQRPLAVLAIACVAVTFAAPVGTVPVLVALYTAAPRLSVWRGLLAWSGAAAASVMVGSAVAAGSFGFYQVTSQAVSGAGTWRGCTSGPCSPARWPPSCPLRLPSWLRPHRRRSRSRGSWR